MFFLSKSQLLLFFLVMCFLSGNAQEEITTTKVLLGARKIEQVKFDSIQLAFLKNYNHNLRLIDNVEFRTETRDLKLSRQEYAVRIKPNSLRGRLADKKLYNSKINEVQVQGRIRFMEELEDRYYLLVAYIFNERLIKAYNYRKTQLDDKIRILKPDIYTENFNINDLIDSEEALFNNQIILQNLQHTQTYYSALLQTMVGNSKNNNQLNSDDIVTPEQIIENAFLLKAPKDNLEIELKKIKLETIEDEMNYDVAKSKKIIDFVQFKYGGKNSEFFDENFAIGMGINLPFFGNTKKIRGDYYFKKLDTESEILELQIDKEKQVNTAEENFRKIATNYQGYKKQAANSSVSSLLETYSKIEGISPIILLKLKMSEHRKNIEIIKIEQQLYETYIEMLVSKNILFQTPFKNFLSTNTLSFTID